MSSKKEDLKSRIIKESDFIYAPRFNNSLEVFLRKYPDGIDDHEKIGKLLLMSKEEVDKIMEEALRKLRTAMGVK